MILWAVAANAEECLRNTFNITYSCGTGSSVASGKSLPANITVAYGQTVTPTGIAHDVCTVPTGKMWAGNMIDTTAITSNSTIPSFKYYYTHDSEITPRWLDAPTTTLSQKFLQDNYRETVSSFCMKADTTPDSHYNNQNKCSDSTWNTMVTNDWAIILPYGEIIGTSRCSTTAPANTSEGIGYIADDQAAIQTEYDTNAPRGTYCYCKLKSPSFTNSPWVFVKHFSNGANYCMVMCPRQCAEGTKYGSSPISFKRALFS